MWSATAEPLAVFQFQFLFTFAIGGLHFWLEAWSEWPMAFIIMTVLLLLLGLLTLFTIITELLLLPLPVLLSSTSTSAHHPYFNVRAR